MSAPDATVDKRLLERLSGLLLCSRCLCRGVKTPVAQVISPRHRPRTLCPECREFLAPTSQPPARAAPLRLKPRLPAF